MASPTAPTSPWTFYDSGNDYLNRKITATVTFDGSNNLTGATVVRDAGCVYAKVIIGALTAAGTPSASAKVLNVPAGTTNFNVSQLAAVGLTTVDDIRNVPQITASP